MTTFSTGSLEIALRRVGSDPARRRRLIDWLLREEASLASDGLNVREEITGPIVDALYGEGEQVERTLSSGLTLSFPYRSKIARDFVMSSNERPDHVWEPQTTKLLLSLGETAKTVIIGGAYFGDQAIPLAQVMQKGGGVCHCFDINIEQINMLAQNATRNRLNNVVINRKALWDHDDRRLVVVGDDSHASAREASAEERAGSFSTTTIATYAKTKKINQIDLIMLDIEGAELPALKGARSFLSQPNESAPAIIFEVHRCYVDWSLGLNRTDIGEFLAGLGYGLFAIRDYQSNVDMKGRPVELVPIDSVFLEGPPHGFNMLAVKDASIFDRKGFKITPNVSPKLLFHRDPRIHQPLF